ncbi:MAG: hypothetical protein IOD12_13860 [Silvanigrellales bacterium]|jgi:hypothetical protein|nr:hypothetical protein [Silvanigrellales bacterium]
MGFEKALKSIEGSPRDAEKRGAYLLLVTQEKNADVKAEAFASLAHAVASVDAAGAFDYIESAFKLAPQNPLVLRTLVSLFERRGRRDAADVVRGYMKKEGPPPVLDKTPDAFGKVPRSLLPRVRKAKPSEGERDLCRSLLSHCEVSEGHLAVAAEFLNSSHSVVGLVHFCHYLIFSGHVEDVEQAVSWVKERVDGSPPSTKARERYLELLAPYAKRARALGKAD